MKDNIHNTLLKNRDGSLRAKKRLPFKLGTHVTCLGDAPTIFEIIDLDDYGAFLRAVGGDPESGHGWEDFHKLTRVKRIQSSSAIGALVKEIRRLKDKISELETTLETVKRDEREFVMSKYPGTLSTREVEEWRKRMYNGHKIDSVFGHIDE